MSMLYAQAAFPFIPMLHEQQPTKAELGLASYMKTFNPALLKVEYGVLDDPKAT
jgi:hypothetical protein